MNFTRTGKKILNSLSPVVRNTPLKNIASYNLVNLNIERENMLKSANQSKVGGLIDDFNHPTDLTPQSKEEKIIFQTLFSNTKDSFTDKFIWGRNNRNDEELMENEQENEEMEAKANEEEEEEGRNKKDDSDNDDDDDGNGGVMMPVVEWIGGLIPRVAKAV